MFCAMIWVTESSTTLADAPGYVARISTEGGATVGYIETGRVKIDSAPASMMMIAMTHAKMGRSMKKRAMGVSVTPARPARARSEEYTSETQSIMRISSAVVCL